MNVPADTLAPAIAYRRVIFLALPLIYLYAFVMAVLRGAGDSKTPMYFLLLSVTLDIALNPLLIFGFIPARGISGFGAGHTACGELLQVWWLVRKQDG